MNIIDKFTNIDYKRLLTYILIGFVFLVVAFISTFIIDKIQIAQIMSRIEASYGGKINLIIFWISLSLLPVIFFILLQISSLSSLIALTIAFFPFTSRLKEAELGIYAYRQWYGRPFFISGIALLVVPLFIYHLLRFRVKDSGWFTTSSLMFWLLAASGIFTQFLFFPFVEALRVGYLVMGCQLLWYLIVVRGVKCEEDAIKVIWGIVIAVFISFFFAIFTTRLTREVQGIFRLESNTLGRGNEYGLINASTICLLPILFFRTKKLVGKIALIGMAIIFGAALLLTMTRGAYFSIFPILGYLLLGRRIRGKILPFFFLSLIIVFLFSQQIWFYITLRGLFVPKLFEIDNVAVRLAMSWSTLVNLLSDVKHFLVGYGMPTFENLDNSLDPSTSLIISVQHVHQEMLNIWVRTGLFGLLGFIGWIVCTFWTTLKRIANEKAPGTRLLLYGLIFSICSWIIFFFTTASSNGYAGGWHEVYAILTTKVALLVALSQKKNTNRLTKRVI